MVNPHRDDSKVGANPDDNRTENVLIVAKTLWISNSKTLVIDLDKVLHGVNPFQYLELYFLAAVTSLLQTL